MMVIIITIISIIIMIILPTIPLTKHLQCNFNSILNISLPEADSTMIPTVDDALIEFVTSPPLTPDRDDNDEPEAIIITNNQPLYDLNAVADQP
jgi:hypothetical protein